MNGPELLKALFAAAGDNPYRVATRLKNPPLQSYASKFITGKVKEPRRDSLRPLAEHYGVPLEAFYDPDLADQVAADRKLTSGITSQNPKPISEETSELARALDVLTKVLQEADESVLMAVTPLLSAMASDPTTAKNKSALIIKLLVADRDKSHEPSQDRMRQPHISVNLGVLDLGDKNGRRDTDAAAGGRKK
jgi:transcriptional regulator with XRE-family HTH domain